MTRTITPRTALALATTIGLFGINTLTPMRDAVAALYSIVVLLIADERDSRTILLAGIGCCVLSTISFFVKHFDERFDGAYIRLAVSISAITIVTYLAIRARQARRRLAEQAAWLAMTHDTVIVHDTNGVIIDWNEGATRLYGWSRSEALGRSQATLLHTRHADDHLPPTVTPAMQWAGEITRVRRDGVTVLLSSRWLGRVDENGNAAGIIELSADLTAQRTAQEGWQRSEARYAAIFAGTGAAIFDVSRHGAKLLVQEANAAAARLMGALDAPSLVNFSLGHHLPLTDHTRALVLMEHLANGTAEMPARLRDLQSHWHDVILTISPGAEAGRLLITALDITERVRAQQRAARLQADLAHSARISALGQMTVTIAHEVNQPLQAMAAFARSARRWLGHEPPNLMEAASCLDRIGRSAERTGQVVKRIREMSRNAPPQMQPVRLAPLVADVVDLLAREIATHQVTFTLGKLPEEQELLGDPIQVQQVLVNVILNALQAMDGSPRRVLSLHTDLLKPSELHVIIDDTGPGFNQMTMQDAFKPFRTSSARQPDSRPLTSDGVGIGLSICRRILDAHGGRIELGSAPGGGARVTLIWPTS